MFTELHFEGVEADGKSSPFLEATGTVVLVEVCPCLTRRLRSRDNLERYALAGRDQGNPNLVRFSQFLGGNTVALKITAAELDLFVFLRR